MDIRVVEAVNVTTNLVALNTERILTSTRPSDITVPCGKLRRVLGLLTASLISCKDLRPVKS